MANFNNLRKNIHHIVDIDTEGHLPSRIFDIVIIVLIVVNVFCIILESIPYLEAKYYDEFYYLELFSITVFTLEYIIRLWASPEIYYEMPPHKYEGLTENRLRLKYIFTPGAIIDLIAIAPFYLFTVIGFGNTLDLRFIRVIRLLRIFKLTKYSQAMSTLIKVLNTTKNSLIAALVVLLLMMLIASSGMYIFEHRVQPEKFGSIPASMWWAFVTLTTVGYGDVTPVTVGGKIFGAVITIMSIGIVALPAGILASAFNEQVKERKHKFQKKLEDFLEDGIISQEELKKLDEMSRKLGMDENTKNMIMDTYLKKMDIRGQEMVCPHCDKTFIHKP